MVDTEVLRQKLSDPDSEQRIAAVRALSELSEPSMPLFALSLGDADWRVRKASVEMFLQLDQPEAFIPNLLKLLYHEENAGLRNAAIEILIGLGSRAVVALRGEISAADVEVRKFVIDVLGEIGGQGCVPELIHALADEDINVRYAAAETLGKIKAVLAVEPLLEMMSASDTGLKFTILQALANIGTEIPVERLFLYLEDPLLRKALFDCFAKAGGPEVVSPLIVGLTDSQRQVREAALVALDQLRLSQLDRIKAGLATADVENIAIRLEQVISGNRPHLKAAALVLYGSVASARDLSLLLSCVAIEELHSHALAAFADLGEEPYSRLIMSLPEPDSIQRICLVLVAGELRYVSALSLVIDAAHSEDPQLRKIVARALGHLAGETQVALLQQLLDDEMSDIRDEAALAMAAFAKRHKHTALQEIVPLLSTPAADKRMRIVRILGMIGGQECESKLLNAFKDSSVGVRCEAVRALNGHFSDIVVSGLILALTDEAAEVRRLAVDALGQCSRVRALPALSLAAVDADLWVRAAAMRALASFTDATVHELLLQGAADPVGLVVIAALESSLVVMPEQSRTLLEKSLLHADEEVVKSAMELLSSRVDTEWIEPFTATLLNHRHRDVRLLTLRILSQNKSGTDLKLLKERLAVETDAAVRQAIAALSSSCVRNSVRGS